MTSGFPTNPTSPKTAQTAAPVTRQDEMRVVGHLLGRKEGVSSIAHAVGFSVPHAQAVCDALCQQGKLVTDHTESGVVYALSVRTGR